VCTCKISHVTQLSPGISARTELEGCLSSDAALNEDDGAQVMTDVAACRSIRWTVQCDRRGQ